MATPAGGWLNLKSRLFERQILKQLKMLR